MSTTMRLVDPATSTELLNLTADTELAGRLLSLDVGYPTVRSVSTSIAGAHGESDTTQFMGARAISAVVALPVFSDAAVDTLSGYMNPGLRLWMYVKRDGWAAERRILVRAASFSCPPGVNRQAQAGWVAPTGLFEDSTVSTVTLSPSGMGGAGLNFALSYPKNYGRGVIPGYAYVTVGGTVPAAPTIDIYGPCSAPSVRLVGTNQTIKFTNLTIAAGSFLRVDLGARTAFLNADPTQSQYANLDFTVSAWWTLPAGFQQLVFSPTNPGSGCQAVVSWRNRTIAG